MTNEEVLKRPNKQAEELKTVKLHKLEYFTYVMRHLERLVHLSMHCKMF